MVDPKTRLWGVSMALTTCLAWGFLAILLKYALSFASTGTIVWCRFFFAFLILISVYLVRKPKALSIFARLPWRAVLAGVFLAINYTGYLRGVELTSPSNAQILIQSGPIMLLFIGVLFFKERPQWFQWVGIGVAVIGLSLFFGDQLSASWLRRDQYLRGNLWIIVAAVTWAGFAGFQKVLTRFWTPQQINLLIYATAALVLFPFVRFEEIFGFTAFQWGYLFVLGLNTIVAYGSLGEALNSIPATQVSMIITTNPIITLVAMALISHLELSWLPEESISIFGYLGALVVVTGVILALYRPSRIKHQ